jgi:predicted protein tyrosine phosphatase
LHNEEEVEAIRSFYVTHKVNVPLFGKLLVLPKSFAANFVCDKPWACISIGSEPGDWPKINKCQQVDILQIAFADINKPIEDCPELILFSPQHAQQIWDFVDKVWDQVDLLMVHCLAGVCRSPAVAAAISQIKYNDDSLYFDIYHPNTLVYNTMLKVKHE